MKLGELKVIHIVLVLVVILWGLLFFDNQWNKRIGQLERNQLATVVNQLNNRILVLEGGKIPIPTPSPEIKKEKR